MSVLSRRALNRALLARQLLLERAPMPIGGAVEHLVGLQAQATMPPYHGLWSRLEGFRADDLGRLLTDRELVRLTLMRGTVHLVTARDAVALRPLTQPSVERVLARWLVQAGAERDATAAAARDLLRTEGPLTARELGARLAARGLGTDAEALGNAARVHAALVQVPPRGVRGAGGQARYAPLEDWVTAAQHESPSLEWLVSRYLGAFGPASVRDAQNWSGLTRLTAVFERLRRRLVSFRDEDGVELFDLSDAPRPDPAVPAPVRLLGQFDNVILGHADRRRIVPPGLPWEPMRMRERHMSNLLVDGELRGAWWMDGPSLVVRPIRALAKAERDEVAAEAEAMLAAFGGAGVRFEAA